MSIPEPTTYISRHETFIEQQLNASPDSEENTATMAADTDSHASSGSQYLQVKISLYINILLLNCGVSKIPTKVDLKWFLSIFITLEMLFSNQSWISKGSSIYHVVSQGGRGG